MTRRQPVVRVLVVEDEAVAARTHTAYVERLEGFAVAGTARSAAEAARLLERQRDAGTPVDLVLLDLHLPDGHGLSFLAGARARGHLADVLAVTSAREVEVVRRAVAQGVVGYLLKPFTFPSFRARMEGYLEYRARMLGVGAEGAGVEQDEVDALMGAPRAPRREPAVPKGLSADTLREVAAAVRRADAARSASEVAAEVGASRVTVRRYLEHLADSGQVTRHPRYGRGGRPELEYAWADAGT